MKILFWNENIEKGSTVYTLELLKYLALKNSHEIVKTNPELICISLTSHYEINQLKKCRKKYPKNKIIVGGHVSNAPAILLEYADFVNLGHGFEFFEKVKNIEDIEHYDFIVSKNKLKGRYSNYINWVNIPVVRIGKNSFSYLESVGCSKKCKFCLTSWHNKYVQNQNNAVIKNISQKYKSKQLYMIGNNYENISCDLKVSDITIKGYNLKSKQYNKFQLIRVGIESPCEKTRKSLNKNIKDDEIIEFFQRTKYYNKRCNIFMIAGLDSQEIWEDFINNLDVDYIGKPGIGFVINYFDPSMGTPMYNYDLTSIIPLNIPEIKRKWKLRNARIKIFRDLKVSWKNSTIDSLMQRSPWGYAEKLLKLKQKVYKNIKDFHEDIDKLGLIEVARGNFTYPIKLTNWHNKNYWNY